MLKLLAITAALAACTDPTTADPQPDAAELAHPCDYGTDATGTTCHAASTVAFSQCLRLEQCGGDRTPVLECMDARIPAVLGSLDPTAKYGPWQALDACVVAYESTGCGGTPTPCSL